MPSLSSSSSSSLGTPTCCLLLSLGGLSGRPSDLALGKIGGVPLLYPEIFLSGGHGGWDGWTTTCCLAARPFVSYCKVYYMYK